MLECFRLLQDASRGLGVALKDVSSENVDHWRLLMDVSMDMLVLGITVVMISYPLDSLGLLWVMILRSFDAFGLQLGTFRN